MATSAEGAAPSSSAGRPVLASMQGVSKSYRTPKRPPVDALVDFSLDVHEGEFVSIVGPSGCGKSTAMSILGGLTPPTQGTVTVLGKQVNKPVVDVGTVFQRDLLLPWRTTLENVLLQSEIRRLPKAAATVRARGLLDQVGLGDFEDRLPRELSGGMRQRVSIVRALLHDPPLLLMDEPFAALDAITRDQMNLDIAKMSTDEGKTVLFITHSIEEAAFLSDRVIVLAPRPGRIVAEINIDLERPRDLDARDSSTFRAYTRELRHLLEDMGAFGKTRSDSATGVGELGPSR